jgi:hypothetical protein
VVFVLVLILAGCGRADRAAHRPPSDGATPIVLVKRGGGLAPPAAQWALPDYVLTGDGTAILRADDQGIVLSARQRRLSTAQIDDLFRRAGDADLFEPRTYPRNVVDGSTLVVRVTSTTGRYVTQVRQPVPGERGDRGRVAAFADTASTLGEPAGDYPLRRAAVLVVVDSD